MNVNTIKYASQAQIKALLGATATSVRDHAIFTVTYWRGLRACEVGKLSMGDYKADTGRLCVHRAKHGDGGEYLLCDDERRALAAWLKIRGNGPGPLFPSRKQKPISRQMLHTLMAEYANRAGWPENLAHPHVLRHSIATHLSERGVDVLAIKDWLGHRSITSTQIYAQITNARRDAVASGVYRSSQENPKMPVPVRVAWRKDRRRARAAQ